MKYHDNSTRKIFNHIHLAQNKNKFSVDKIKFSLNEKVLNLKKGFFKGKICADLGCGSTGAGGFNLLNLGAKYCHLLDMHQHIKKPIKKNLKKFSGKYKISIGSLEKLPFKKEFFDFVMCQGVIHHMDNDLKGFKEIYRVLKKGKHLSFTFHNRDLKIWQSVIDAVNNAGFEMQNIVYQEQAVASGTQGINFKNTFKGDFVYNFVKSESNRVFQNKNIKNPTQAIEKKIDNIFADNDSITIDKLYEILIPYIVRKNIYSNENGDPINIENILAKKY